MIRRLLAVVALTGLALLVAPVPAPVAADPIIVPDPLAPIDAEVGLSCTELVPHALSVGSAPAVLDLRVLLDGVSQADAERAVAAMRVAYASLGISVAATYQAVAFTPTDAAELNAAAKAVFGGQRPAGVDVVYTMTSKDITSTAPTGSNVAGMADCIGGVRFADRAFAVGENIPDGPGSVLGVPLPTQLRDAAGKTMAHEVGHLLGGHHHYTSAEGLLAADPNVADLMGPTLSIISLRFSTLNGLMVRGHVEAYA